MSERLSPGSALSHYEIVAPLGAGGMGEVYLAQDTSLDRRVAVKVLPQEFRDDERARGRFLREARAAARLNHPHICAVHEVGEDGGLVFIVMQHIEGETLAERMRRGVPSHDEVRRIMKEAAGALAEAHAQAIVHRDIKPQNMMLNRRGELVILDFGLAKLTGSADDSDLTRTNAVNGTVPYMSPEQLRGEPLDGRTDLFSLGVVLYELLNGHRPFEGATAAHVITAILTKDPAPMHAEAGDFPLARIALRCLARERDERYRSAVELLDDLRALEQSAVMPSDQHLVRTQREIIVPAPTVPTQVRTGRSRTGRTSRKSVDSLAVLPLQTTSANAEAEFLSEGITETLIGDLSRLPKLRVMARATVFRYKGSELDPLVIGQELGVRAVLSGRVQVVGDRFVVRVELVDVEDGTVLWGEQFARTHNDIIQLQEEIASEISTKLRPTLTPVQKKRVTTRQTRNPEAYQQYVKGVYYLNRRDVQSMKTATELFHEAIAIDPAYAAPYCGLAETYIYFGFLEMRAPRDVYPAARAAAEKALELDASFAEAHAALGWMKVTHEWDWKGAEKELAAAVRLNPSSAVAHHWYGLLLSYTRRFEAAREKMLLAQQLDPLAPIVNTGVGLTAYHSGDFAEALRIYDGVADMAPKFVPLNLYRGMALEAAGRFEDAAAMLRTGLSYMADDTILLAALGHCLGVMGDAAGAEEMRRRLETRRAERYTSAYGLALVSAGLDDEEATFRWLEAAYEERAAWLTTVNVDPRWDAWRGREEFAGVMRRAGLG